MATLVETPGLLSSFFLRVKFEADAFGRVPCFSGGEVEDFLWEASTCQGWNLLPTKLQLCLVAPSGAPEPSASELMSALSSKPLPLGVTLSALGILSGAWVVARRTTPSSHQVGSPKENFRSLLSAQGVQIDPKIFSIIAHSWTLSTDSVQPRPHVPVGRGRPGSVPGSLRLSPH